LDLLFAETPKPDAALLALEVGPPAGQVRRQVLELRELDLVLRFLRAGVLREDVEDDAGAVDDAHPERFLEVLLLRSRKLVVERDERAVELLHADRYLLGLSLPD